MTDSTHMSDATPNPESTPIEPAAADGVDLTKTATPATAYFHADTDLPPAPEPQTSLLPNLALIFAIEGALWWFLLLLSSSFGNRGGDVAEVLLSVLFLLGFPSLGLWIAGLVLAHKSFRRTKLHTPANRGKLIAALVLLYAQVPLILGALGLALIGILFIGLLAFGGGSGIN